MLNNNYNNYDIIQLITHILTVQKTLEGMQLNAMIVKDGSKHQED